MAFLTALLVTDRSQPLCYIEDFNIISAVETPSVFRPPKSKDPKCHPKTGGIFGKDAVTAVDNFELRGPPRDAKEIWQLNSETIAKGPQRPSIVRHDMDTRYGRGNWNLLYDIYLTMRTEGLQWNGVPRNTEGARRDTVQALLWKVDARQLSARVRFTTNFQEWLASHFGHTEGRMVKQAVPLKPLDILNLFNMSVQSRGTIGSIDRLVILAFIVLGLPTSSAFGRSFL
jgi:hypothetical protein